MSKQTMKLLGCVLGVASLALAGEAKAADPVTGGSANIGTHSSYAGFTAFWRTGRDYSVLADDSSTYLNAPNKNGILYFRGANSDWAQLSKYGLWLANARIYNTWISVGDNSSNNQDGLASIGNHPSYGRGYAGFWLTTPNLATQHWDYSLLTDGANTFLNAPDGDGILYFRGANNERMNLTSSALNLFVNKAAKPGGGSWAAVSDVRVKKDVKRFELGLAELEQVQPVTFKYNGLGGSTATDQQFVGVIAQELEKALPFMVSSEPKKLHPEDKQTTDVKQVDPSAFTYVLINAVQELSKQNKVLAEQNQQIKRVLCKDHPNEALCKH